MHERHTDRERYFKEQAFTTRKHVIPFINFVKTVNNELSVIEIGCGEGGNLLPFLEADCRKITGVDLSSGKIENAKKFYSSIPNGEKVEFIASDIYDIKDHGTYDLILMRDVLEHIHDQGKFMGFVKKFVNTGGILFIAFPPWYNPFGGHQQMCTSKFLSKVPWIHLLPVFLYKGVLKLFGESKPKIEAFLEIKETGINLGRFEKIIKKEGFLVLRKSLWFINPNFEVKFGLRPRHLPVFLAAFPLLRDFIATTSYYVISVQHQEH